MGTVSTVWVWIQALETTGTGTPIRGFGIGDVPSWFRCGRLDEGWVRYRPS
jgi:hypothetical protein